MVTSWLLTNTVAALLLPPANLLLVGLLGVFFLARRRATLGKVLIIMSMGGLWLLSLPLVSDALIESLTPPYQALRPEDADAIVILGGGRQRDDIEYGGDTAKDVTLERLRYGAYIAKKLDKPILVTGGKPTGGALSEARVMANILEAEFHRPVRWLEERSNNTIDNARFTAKILLESGIKRIYLVSHGWHLKRAIPQFERLGLTVIPAGFNYMPDGPLNPLHFLPSADSLAESAYATHEWIGILWYRIRNLLE